jgi:hypothetical protein
MAPLNLNTNRTLGGINQPVFDHVNEFLGVANPSPFTKGKITTSGYLGLTYGSYRNPVAGGGVNPLGSNEHTKTKATNANAKKSSSHSRKEARRNLETMEKDRRLGKIRVNLNTSIGKLPVELRRAILKSVLPHGMVIRPGTATNEDKMARTLARAHAANANKPFEGKASSAILSDHLGTDNLNMATTLLTTDSTVIGSVAEMILYEDQIFGINVYEDGVEFLDLPRIPKFGNMKSDFAAMYNGGFQVFDNGPFRFSRLKHLEFRIHSPSLPDSMDYVYKARDAGIRMEQNIAFLVDKLVEENGGPFSISVRFLDVVGSPRLAAVQDDYWVRNAESPGPRPSHIMFMSTVEFMLKPFRNLRNIGKVEVHLPRGLELDEELNAAVVDFRQELRGNDERHVGFLAREGAMMVAFEEQRYRERCLEKKAEDMAGGIWDARKLANKMRAEAHRVVEENYHLKDIDFLEEVSELGSDFDNEGDSGKEDGEEEEDEGDE